VFGDVAYSASLLDGSRKGGTGVGLPFWRSGGCGDGGGLLMAAVRLALDFRVRDRRSEVDERMRGRKLPTGGFHLMRGPSDERQTLTDRSAVCCIASTIER
jgi:hypothetical protein